MLKFIQFKLYFLSQGSFRVGWFSSATGLAKGKRNTIKIQAVFMSRFLCRWRLSIADRRELSLSQRRQVLTESIVEVQWGSQRGEWLFSIGPHGHVLHVPHTTDCTHTSLRSLCPSFRTESELKHVLLLERQFQIPSIFQSTSHGLVIP